MAQSFEFGLDTFGDVTRGPDGNLLPQAQVIRNVVAEAVLADELGVDFFGVGEHHRDDFAVSAPEVVLGAIAARTSRIRLGSAVTVLSSDDPIRVYQRFSTLNALSNGRAEIILGRGSFTESFPLFGHPLSQYDMLFDDKIALFAALIEEQPVTWQGQFRTPLVNQPVYPPFETGKLTTWIGVGGAPESVARAALYGFPLALGIIGGDPRLFIPLVELYRRVCAEIDKPVPAIAVHSPGYVAASDAQAREEFWPDYQRMVARLGAERGWPPMTRADYEREIEAGALYVGAPETVARKIVTNAPPLGACQFHLKYSTGQLPHEKLMRCIELFGREVIPLAREMLASAVTA